MNNSESLYFAINLDESLKKTLEEEFKLEFSPLKLFEFPDGEYFSKPTVSVRGKKVFIFHSLSSPVNDNIMKLLITVDACKRSSASEITLIINYLSYARQDRKTEERSPITSKLIADLISNSGATRIVTVDLHSDQIEGFFNIPIDHLYTTPLFAEYLISEYGEDIKNFTIVSPDFGATKKARMLSNLLSIPIVIMEKLRDKEGSIEEHNIYGKVNFKKCLILDDIIGTGGTVLKASRTLKKLGAETVLVCATHALFNGNAWKAFEEAFEEGIIEKVIISDSIPVPKTYKFINIVSLARLLFNVMKIYEKGCGSVSKIYEDWAIKIIENRARK
ncbi:ribose-phosphate diphosphokinase [Mycoplasma parvum]|uniref:ribose-phosphate diphosphokinase n=1 Tax=Mycoplasma parvum str. Indiana TaxID=1403316 RepID=U5NBL2_9MOLU|nr:ribose-phosphate diphosphokinase [Mycoplasma parvum]AGX88807.1 ribose-phosphate pyrophosphokinase [Mycoplasma parvum str. Indiana]